MRRSSRTSPEATIEAKALAAAIAQIAAERKAEDVEVIEVAERLKVADYFVVATGNSRAHVKALYNELHARTKAAGIGHHPAEGVELGWWIVLDFGDVVAHVLQRDARTYYDIERLYNDCPRLDWRNVPAALLPEPVARRERGA